MPAKKKVTLEQIYAKLETHDQHFEKHDRQFEGITKLIFRVEDSLKAEIAKVMDRVQKLEAIVEKQAGDLERLQQEYFALTQAVKRIEKNIEALVAEKRNHDEQISAIHSRLDRIERHLGLTETAPQATR